MKDFTPFLKQVASKYYSEGGIERLCFVFPNRRSMVFFKKYLAEVVMDSLSGVPVLSPQMLTENDFFCKVTGSSTTDRISLLLELYKCYRDLNPKAESLDDFIFWGDILIADFNDVDKYLVDPHRLYTNVSDLKSMRDDFSYLTQEQRTALEKFLGHFVGAASYGSRSDDHSEGKSGDRPGVKERFVSIWNLLEPLYLSFNRALREKNCAYEGMIYREFAESLTDRPVADLLGAAFPRTDKYVFVGLNALNECEKTVLRRMRDAFLAEFCWDYTGTMIKDKSNKSSLFMEENIKEFPQSHSWEDVGENVPDINVVSVPSSVGQAKIVPELLDGAGGVTGADYAIVLPDETLLTPLLNTIPPQVRDINVTMGCSMASSALFSLLQDIASMQLHLRQKNGLWSYYHRSVSAIFSSGIFTMVADDSCREIIKKIKREAKIYIPQEDLKGNRLLELVFRPIVEKPRESDSGQIHRFAEYLMEIVGFLGAALAGNGAKWQTTTTAQGADKTTKESAMTTSRESDKATSRESAGSTEQVPARTMVQSIETEFAKVCYCELNKLSAKELAILPSTWIKLMNRLLSGVSVPFRGEPLRGLQIMGPLETRALDFRNLIILSANEGIFPSRNVSSSFIPPELRKGFGLPTYEYQDAVWAYYFYRMIARAKNVRLVYDSRTEGMNTGEESRYIKQLALHFNKPVRRFVASASAMGQPGKGEIPKTEEDVAVIRGLTLSASSIKSYLKCPAMFYYSKVKGLKTEDEVSENADAGVIGNVYHKTMQALYSGKLVSLGAEKRVSAGDLESWVKGGNKMIRSKVDIEIMKELHCPEVTGRNLVVAEVVTDYVLQTIRRDLELLRDRGGDEFRIEGLELSLDAEIDGTKIKGYIDRLDKIGNGDLRVCDYKTGRVTEMDLVSGEMDGEKVAAVVAAIFEKRGKDLPEVALQIFFYDLLLRKKGFGGKILNSVYQPVNLFTSPVEVLSQNEEFYNKMEAGLKSLLEELVNPAVPFSLAEDDNVCQYCDFKKICRK